MKKHLSIILICLLAAITLAGCGTKPEADNNNGSNNNTTVSADQTTLEQYIALLGQEEKGLLDVMGNGVENMAEGTKDVLSRDYQVDLFGQKLPLTAAIDMGKVHDVTINLGEDKYEDWVKKLTESFGKPTETTGPDKEEGNDSQSATWPLTGGKVVLNSAYNTTTMTVYGDNK